MAAATAKTPVWMVLRKLFGAPLADRKTIDPSRILFALDVNERAPIDVDAIAAQLQIPVIKADLTGENLSGKSFVDEESQSAVVMIEQSHSPTRQRFTLAHELWHVLCDTQGVQHRNSLEDGERHDVRERAANQFAAELLMPTSAFAEYQKLLGPLTEAHAEPLARAFNVSKEAMRYRLRWM